VHDHVRSPVAQQDLRASSPEQSEDRSRIVLFGSSRVRGRGLGHGRARSHGRRKSDGGEGPGRKATRHHCAIGVPLATVSSGKLRRRTASQTGRPHSKTPRIRLLIALERDSCDKRYKRWDMRSSRSKVHEFAPCIYVAALPVQCLNECVKRVIAAAALVAGGTSNTENM